MKKRVTALILSVVFVISLFPISVSAASAPEDDRNVFYTPASDYRSGDCILTATKMMIRRASIMENMGDWTSITNKTLRKSATIRGLLLNSFRFDTGTLVCDISSGKFTGKSKAARIREFRRLLKEHPEGIVVHGTRAASTGTHGVLVVRVENGVPYAADSTLNTGISNKGILKWSDTTMLNPKKVKKYWYISGMGVSAKTDESDSSAARTSEPLSIKEVIAPYKIMKGKSFSIRGKIKSDIKLKKVTVRIVDSSGVRVTSATKKLKRSKTFNLKKVDAKIKFGILEEGTYTYQVIASNAERTETLVNRTFTVY